MGRARDFMEGLLAGAGATLFGGAAVLYLLERFELLQFSNGDDLLAWVAWAYTNLGASIPVFAGLVLAFFLTLGRLRRRLAADAPINQVVQLDQLTDTWTTLFFGTGVIWTAIGMRSALLFALGDRQAAVSEGAFAMLERMIDGGILLALSTTIFGGIGGYLMRVYKTVSLGAELQQHYDRAARADTSEMRASLDRIERHLRPQPSSPELEAQGQ